MTAKTVYIHIGPYKTGTTYLQSVLQGNAERLAAHGVLFPRGSYGNQVRSVLDVLGRQINPDGLGNEGQWPQLVQEVHDWGGDRAVISQEFLCDATAKQIGRIVRSLAPAEVHVVFTARELSRVIPASWQTHIRNKRYVTWPEFIGSVRDPQNQATKMGKRFWRQQNPAEVLPPWETHVPRERISIVTVPPSRSDPEQLWRRFCEVCGLDATAYETNVVRPNTSLGLAEAEALRRVNEALDGRMSPKQQTRWVKFFLAREVLEQRPNQIKLQLPVEDYPWVAERSKAMRHFLATGGYRIVGDLDDLITPPPPTTPVVPPDQVDPAAVLDATVDALAAVLVQAREHGPHPYGGKPPLTASGSNGATSAQNPRRRSKPRRPRRPATEPT